MTNTEKRESIVKAAREWVGTPYQHRAQVLGAGVDCAQLLIAIYAGCGFIPRDFSVQDYPMDWHLHRDEERYLNHVLAHAHEVTEPLDGDIALFKFGRTVSHAAIVADWPLVIHAYRPAGYCCVSDVSVSAELQSRLVGFYRLNELKD